MILKLYTNWMNEAIKKCTINCKGKNRKVQYLSSKQIKGINKLIVNAKAVIEDTPEFTIYEI